MPKVVDAVVRRGDIAAAAIAIARSDGLHAVSFRRVAREMGASSTTVVQHYVASRRELIELMMEKMFGDLAWVADQLIPTLDPRIALRLLTENVLPMNPHSHLIARLALDATIELAPEHGLGHGLETLGGWLETRIHELVTTIGSPVGTTAAADLIYATIAGISLYGLVDREAWPPQRQQQTIRTLLDSLGLGADGVNATS